MLPRRVGGGLGVGDLVGAAAEEGAGRVVAQAEPVDPREVGGRGEADDAGEPGHVVARGGPERELAAGGVADEDDPVWAGRVSRVDGLEAGDD